VTDGTGGRGESSLGKKKQLPLMKRGGTPPIVLPRPVSGGDQQGRVRLPDQRRRHKTGTGAKQTPSGEKTNRVSGRPGKERDRGSVLGEGKAMRALVGRGKAAKRRNIFHGPRALSTRKHASTFSGPRFPSSEAKRAEPHHRGNDGPASALTGALRWKSRNLPKGFPGHLLHGPGTLGAPGLPGCAHDMGGEGTRPDGLSRRQGSWEPHATVVRPSGGGRAPSAKKRGRGRGVRAFPWVGGRCGARGRETKGQRPHTDQGQGPEGKRR